MIKFFRNIRQRLLSENKFSKYLIYAGGEIILVVIGIMIALQINNWNQERIAKQQETIILGKLTTDLKWNIDEIEGIRNVTNERLKSTETILNYFENNKPIDDSLRVCFEDILSRSLFNSANTTYKYIENRGMDVLSNDTIRARITNIYETDFNNITRREGRDVQIITSELIPLMDNLFRSSTAQITFHGQELSLNTPLNIEELRKNMQFKNIIVRLQNFFLIRIYWQENTLVELTKLVNDLEKEI